MKRILPKEIHYFFYFFILMFSMQSNAQNIFNGEPVQWAGRPNGYGTNPYNSDYRTLTYRKVSTTVNNPGDGRGQWSTTINVQSSGGNVTPDNMPGGGGSGWLLISGPSGSRFQNKWNFNGVGQAGLNAVNGIVKQGGGEDMGLNMGTAGRYTFNMRDNGYGDSKVFIGYTANTPVTVTRGAVTFASNQPVISIATSAAPSAGENIFVRFRAGSNDFTTATTVVQASGSGTSWTATLPAQTCGTAVYYYVYSSTRTLSQIQADSEEDRSLSVIRFDDNSGANYSLTPTPSTAAVLSGTATICAGGSTNLQVAITGGSSPFTVVYTNGTSNFTISNYVSGTSIAVSPVASVTYTLVSVTGNNGCAGTGNSGSAAVSTNANVTYYADTDGDGFGNAASSVVSCTGQPVGYVANNTDCNDNNVNIYRTGNFYVDADGDGYTVGSQISLCYGATTPVGHAITSLGSDCNDNDASKHATFTFYVDSDHDNYGSTAVANNICAVNDATAPLGYSTVSGDCNDTEEAVNPGATEIPYDGIDNNCDGDFDEGYPLITTALASERCNSVLEKIYHSINANWRVVGSTGYRFKVVNTRTSEVQTIERQNHYFNLTQLAHYDYATKYEVSVELQRYGKWLGYYGTACEVTSPDLPKLDVCGGTVASKNSLVRSQVLLYVTNYRFKVTNFLSGESIIVSNGLQYFSFNQIPGYVAGALYRVQVSVKTTDDWSEFGSICTITAPGGSAPEIPSTKDADNVSGFNAVAYPNPFANGFNLDIAISTSDNVNVKVYDMLGKLIEVREVSATDLKEQELGNSYPAGVYNIIVTQGENLKTVRVIKR